MLLLLTIIGLVDFASGALVHVAAAAVVHVVKLGHPLELPTGNAGGCSFWYRPFGNLGEFVRPRIGLTVVFFDFICVFLGQTAALRARDSGVCWTFVENWTGVLGKQGSSSVSETPKSLQIYCSVSEFAFVKDNVGDIPSCGAAGCGNVAEPFICRVFLGNLRLTCKEMYSIFRR